MAARCAPCSLGAAAMPADSWPARHCGSTRSPTCSSMPAARTPTSCTRISARRSDRSVAHRDLLCGDRRRGVGHWGDDRRVLAGRSRAGPPAALPPTRSAGSVVAGPVVSRLPAPRDRAGQLPRLGADERHARASCRVSRAVSESRRPRPARAHRRRLGHGEPVSDRWACRRRSAECFPPRTIERTLPGPCCSARGSGTRNLAAIPRSSGGKSCSTASRSRSSA